MMNLKIVTDMAGTNQNLRRLLDQIFTGMDSGVCVMGQQWNPEMDIYETEEAYVLLAEMPGLKPENIDIMVERNNIKISGCREQPNVSPPLVVHQLEMEFGVFERSYHLPNPVDPENASAGADNGLLKIVLPKEANRRTRIGITNG
jgi:HSP20 family protein